MIKEIGVFQKFVVISLFFLFFSGFSFGVPGEVDLDSEIWFEASELIGNRWQYTYEVTNVNILAGITELTINFDAGLYDNLTVETDGVLAATWDEIVWDPIVALGITGGYDVLAESFPIGPAMTASGFSVSFDWLGEGTPDSQFYEIIDPDTFETIDSGWTVPEPVTLLLLGLGAIISRKRRN
jgi:hypothetical protein